MLYDNYEPVEQPTCVFLPALRPGSWTSASSFYLSLVPTATLFCLVYWESQRQMKFFMAASLCDWIPNIITCLLFGSLALPECCVCGCLCMSMCVFMCRVCVYVVCVCSFKHTHITLLAPGGKDSLLSCNDSGFYESFFHSH